MAVFWATRRVKVALPMPAVAPTNTAVRGAVSIVILALEALLSATRSLDGMIGQVFGRYNKRWRQMTKVFVCERDLVIKDCGCLFREQHFEE